MLSLSNLFTCTLLVPSILSWGAEGHEIVGSIAQHFLSSNAESQLSSIFNSNGLSQEDLLANIANWADRVKFVSGYTKTATFHYIDIQDTPPTKCGLTETRDCPDGKCITGAIAKYTSQAICPEDSHKKAEAIKFLVHFFGDITQPLHVEDRARGGNSLKILFGKKTINLHHLWDTELVVARISKFGTQEAYVRYLLGEIKNGQYSKQVSSWISSRSYNETSEFGNSLVAIDYAQDSNQFDCGEDGVWSSYDRDPAQDFSGSYTQKAAPIIDLQLAKGGYRLGMYLSHLLSSSCSDTAISSNLNSFSTHRRR